MLSLSDLVQQLALRLFDEAITTQPFDRDKAKLAYELMHVEASLGLGEYQPHPDFDPPEPWPIGPWAAQQKWQLSPAIGFELVRSRAAGDPDPQPNKVSVFDDRELQVEAAENLRDKMQQALKNLEQIIDGLHH